MQKRPQNRQKRKKIEWRRVFVGLLALVMILGVIMPLLGSALTTARAVSESDLQNQISGLKDDAASATERKKELQKQLEAIEKDEAKALERKKILDQQLAALDQQLANTQSQIDTYTTLISEQEIALADAQEREKNAYERFRQRARAMEEAGDISYWSVLFSASDFSDLLDRLAMVDEIMEYDNNVVDTIVAVRQEVEQTLASLNESKAALDEQKAQLDIQREEQAAKVAEAQALFDQLKTQADKMEELVKAEEAEEAKIAAEIDAKQKELNKLIASKQITFSTGTGYAYPLPSSNTTVTSEFGWRTHPITGKPNNHTGIDIAAPKNTSIYAVKGGVVTVSGYAPSSYGNYVVIDHGNNETTLYAHMTSRAVSVGDVVSQGQTIGYVGMTGSANGNHLHLEWKINGVRQNALGMFPNMNFTIW